MRLLLIVDQSGEHGRAFVWEEGIAYTDIDGKATRYFVMQRDLRVLERLAERGLITSRMIGYSPAYTINDAGKRAINARREGSK